MRSPSELSDTALVRRHEALSVRISKLIEPLIAAGFGSYRFSDYAAMDPTARPKLVSRYVDLVEESSELRTEAERRYGPGLITVRQLLY